ncbi:MAG: hypothetical protein IPL08_07410 [Saprospiraceae bacterium]|nr:hypothetical protein [Saprospiraceae bacterium]
MKIQFIIPILLVLTSCLMSCKSSKVAFDPTSTKKEYFSFGSGGGFTGKVIKYYLTKDGILYTKDGEDIKKAGMAPKAIVNQLFQNFTGLGLDKIELNDPGNKYSFIESQSKGTTYKLQWGKNPLENKNVETFYSILMDVVKKINLSSQKS